MPYIKNVDRAKFISGELEFLIDSIENEGELNYFLTEVILGYIGSGTGNYTMYNSVIGALECCKLEIYRRLIAPYEELKCKENGDVY